MWCCRRTVKRNTRHVDGVGITIIISSIILLRSAGEQQSKGGDIKPKRFIIKVVTNIQM